MVRVINFFCVALIGLTVLGLYHVSERTRVASVELQRTERQMVQEKSAISVLEAEWARVAGPARIQALAESKLGMSDTASVQLSSLELLPHRGEAVPTVTSNIREASAVVPAQALADTSSVIPASVETGGY